MFKRMYQQKAATVKDTEASKAFEIFGNVEYIQVLDDADLMAVVGGASEQIPLTYSQQLALINALGFTV